MTLALSSTSPELRLLRFWRHAAPAILPRTRCYLHKHFRANYGYRPFYVAPKRLCLEGPSYSLHRRVGSVRNELWFTASPDAQSYWLPMTRTGSFSSSVKPPVL